MQKYTSKNTSVNITKAPAVYNKVRWDKLPKGVRVLDWGCGIMISVKMFYLYLIIISFGLPAVWETWVRSLSLEDPLD